jgi:hypothetical protein
MCQSKTIIAGPAAKSTVRSKALMPGFPDAPPGHSGSPNWSGYDDTLGHYTSVGADWYATGALPCSCTGPTNEATWVGIGGIDTGKLLQDGIGNYSNTAPYAWFEYLGATSIGMMDHFPVQVGDTIEAQVIYTSASGGKAVFHVYDNGFLLLNEKLTPASGDYDPDSAEWINERPGTCKNCFPPLTNTGTTYWWDANAFNSSGTEVAVANGGVHGTVMTSDGLFLAPPCNGDMLQYPDTLVGDTFESHWCRAD